MTDHSIEDLILPEISRTSDGTIVVELDPEQASVLAKVLAHYDVLAKPHGEAADGYVPEVWHHTLIQILGKAAEINVPLLRSPGDIERVLHAVQDPR